MSAMVRLERSAESVETPWARENTRNRPRQLGHAHGLQGALTVASCSAVAPRLVL